MSLQMNFKECAAGYNSGMAFDPAKHHRRSIRLQGHDYASGGVYFVTICAHREFIATVGATCMSPVRASGTGIIMK